MYEVAPETVDALKLIAFPEQTGLLLLAVGAAGTAFTTTVVVLAGELQPFTVTKREYTPAKPTTAPGLVGSSREEEKLLGPLHVYVAAGIVFALKLMV